MGKIINFLLHSIFFVPFFLGGFTFIVIGIYLMPQIFESIDIGISKNLFEFLYSGGIAGGAIAISYTGLKLSFYE